MNAPPLLTLLTFTPVVGALAVIGLAQEQKRLARWLSLGCSLLALGLTLVLWHYFDSASGDLQFHERHRWIPALGVEYRVGVDGLGLLMVLLSAIVVPMAAATIAAIRTQVVRGMQASIR